MIKLKTLTAILLPLISLASFALNTTSTANPQVQKISQVLHQYETASSKEWPSIHANDLIKPGSHNPNIPLIREHLIVLGDLKSESAAAKSFYDAQLFEAVKHFQWRHGLKVDGIIGPQTLSALNVSPAQRLQQLYINLHRWQKFPNLGANYVWVNIPNYELELIMQGKPTLTMRVIVGKPDRPTPVLSSKINTLVLNPSWNIPDSIIRKDIIPKILQNPNYLAENNMRIYSNWENNASVINPYRLRWQALRNADPFPYKISQLPGKKNALGEVKFVFQNTEDVYMHDTPAKDLFDSPVRAFSSGCIRLEEPFKLVEYFRPNAGISQTEVWNYLGSGKTKFLPLNRNIPIYIGYLTAWVDSDNQVHFREDIYQKDGMISANN